MAPPPDGGGATGVLDAVSDLADRVGVSLGALVGGAVVAVAVAAVVMVAITRSEPPPAELSIPRAEPQDVAPSGGGHVDGPAASSTVPAGVSAHAAGAVRHPGVYVLSDGARVGELLSAAGGPLPEADLDRVNLAAPVADGTRVYVPRIGEDEPPPVVAGAGTGGGPGSTDPGRLVDLNRAAPAELESLPGIGPATAAAIIDHRERHGAFQHVDDLLDVRGIGEAKLSALRDLVHV